ncbi:hypothetical protein BV20DRAFT_982917 [Pilatotrama ljubarskyi]|nr:hypothetical protein BV20DRAFT_982917 [Pilatotrama ljubarskyi]
MAPADVQTAFADRFFPVPSNATRPSRASNIFDELADGCKLHEIMIMERFTRIVNANKSAPGLRMIASTDRPDLEEVDGFRHKIDTAFFKIAELSSDGRPHWADQVVSVEFKRHGTDMDPFDDRDDRTVDAQAVERKKVRGQIITYAEQIFRLQHRTALYMLLVIGRNFRFVRWDRSGAIVTRPVDYVARPDVLRDFLWRLGKQSDEQLGVDPSATRLYPGEEDYKLMDEYAAKVATDLATDERIVTDAEAKADSPVFKYFKGTWQFLSVGMLSEKPKVPDIPDELESFFYVTLYYAVRYLKSNCTNAGPYLEAFFDAFTVTPEGIYTCGAAKSDALETHGSLYLMRNVELKLDSPLDTIFRKLLLCFRAHYKIQNYRKTKPDDSPGPSDTAQHNDQEFAFPPSSPTTKLIRRAASRLHVLKAFAARKTLLLPPPDAPTREDENNASLIAEHSWMVGVLAEALDSKEWQADKVGDRVPPEYKPQYVVAKLDGPASSTIKRRRAAVAKSAIDFGPRCSGLPAPGFCSGPPMAGASESAPN